MPINRGDIEAASVGNPSLRRTLDQIAVELKELAAVLGTVTSSPTRGTGAATNTVAPPPQLALSVIGGGDNFFITILGSDVLALVPTNAVQSSETLPFETSSTVIQYPESQQTSFVVHAPSKTYYWRLRSKFLNSDYNGWILFPTVVSS